MTKTQQHEKWQWRAFDELTTLQLYSLLKLREQVFQLEQNSLYADLDDHDQQAFHLLLETDDGLMGYLRLLAAEGNQIKMGRIVLHPSARGQQLGRRLIAAGLVKAAAQVPAGIVLISAQVSLHDYYQQLGFVVCSEPYDDGGVLHQQMRLQLH